jgi:hypothetical protein
MKHIKFQICLDRIIRKKRVIIIIISSQLCALTFRSHDDGDYYLKSHSLTLKEFHLSTDED